MKKHLLILISAMLAAAVLTLGGCGGSDNKDTTSDTKATEAATAAPETEGNDEASISAEDVVFSYNGTDVELNTSADAAVMSLGAPLDESSQLSCHGEGDDKTYKYDGFNLNTYPLDGQDMVLEVVINGEGIATNKGIEIGSTTDDVVAAYGDGFREIGMYYAYDAGDGKSLQFFIEDGTVQEIDYYYDV